jgi:uncharacterized protein (TIGR03067 family)
MTAFLRPAVAALALLLLSLPAAGADAPAKPDQEAIQGSWKVTAMSADGAELKPIPKEAGGEMVMKFEGTVVTAKHGAEKPNPADFKLDPAKAPKEIKVSPTDGPEKGKTYNGVYELTGDTLVIAFDGEAGQPTPPDTKPAAKRIVMKLERQK